MSKAFDVAALVVALLFFATTTEAADRTAASCSQAHVQAEVTASSNGDRVIVPAGTCTWSSAVSITNKTITLQGAGSGAGGTKIVYGGTGHTLIDISAGSQTGKTDISGFWFSGGDVNYWSGTAIQIAGPVGWKNLRIHHNKFEDNRQWSIRGSVATYGVIDHNEFTGTALGILTQGRGATDWSTALTFGSDDFFFIEDNTFTWDDYYGSTGVPSVDMHDGGRVVFRYNSLQYGMWETHDKARSGLPSANAWEVYNNTFATTSNKWKGLDMSAGTGVIWGNTFTGDWSVPIGAMDYKTFDWRSLQPCDGNDSADQNTPGQTGWRCQYQLGSQGEGASATGVPVYIWSNTVNGSSATMACTHGCSHLISGRDFINNGTTAKPGYTPYTYPHPLTSAEPDLLAPPTNLQAIPR